MKKRKSKIKINKKKLNKIELIIFSIIVVTVVIILIVTHTPSQEDALILIKEQYNKTEEALAKVILGTSWLEIGDECIEQDGYTFCKSESDNMETYKELKKYVSNFCTTKFTEDILAKQGLMYKDIEGSLYVLDSLRGKDVFYARLNEIRIKSISSHKIQAEVICDYYIDLNSKETYTMSFNYTIEKSFGKWKTSEFTLPY